MVRYKLTQADKDEIVQLYNRGLSYRAIVEYMNNKFRRLSLYDYDGKPLSISRQSVCNVIKSRDDVTGRKAIKDRYSPKVVASLYFSGLSEEEIALKYNTEFEREGLLDASGKPLKLTVDNIHEQLTTYRRLYNPKFRFRDGVRSRFVDIVDLDWIKRLHNEGKTPQEIATLVNEDFDKRGIIDRVHNFKIILLLKYCEGLDENFHFSNTRRDLTYKAIDDDFLYGLYQEGLSLAKMRDRIIEHLDSKGYDMSRRSVSYGMITNKLNKVLESRGLSRVDMNSIHDKLNEITPEFVGELYAQGYRNEEIKEIVDKMFLDKGYLNTRGNPLTISNTTIANRRLKYLEIIGMSTEEFQVLCEEKRQERKMKEKEKV